MLFGSIASLHINSARFRSGDEPIYSVGLRGAGKLRQVMVAIVIGTRWTRFRALLVLLVCAGVLLASPVGLVAHADQVISVSGFGPAVASGASGSLADGAVGMAYSPPRLQIAGGNPPYSLTTSVTSQGNCSGGPGGTISNAGVTGSIVGSQIVFSGSPTEAGGFTWTGAVYDQGCKNSSSLMTLTVEFFDSSVTTPSVVPTPVAENYYHYDGGHCCMLQAVVSSAHAGSGSPAGTVSFSVDGVSEGTAALNYHPYNNPKPTTATLQSATTIGAGTHTIKAVYNADASAATSCFNNWQGMSKNCFLASSGTASFTVLPAPTVTSLYNTSLPVSGRPRFSTGFTVSNDTAKIGGFAQVDPGTTVELLMDGKVVDSAKVPLNSASPPQLAVNVPSGQHTLMAKYLGNANELPSASTPLTVVGSGSTGTSTKPRTNPPTNGATTAQPCAATERHGIRATQGVAMFDSEVVQTEECKPHPKVCNFAMLVGVGFRNDEDLAGSNDADDAKPPKEFQVMVANVEQLIGPLVINWGFDENQINRNKILNRNGTKANIKAGFEDLLAHVRGIKPACEMSTILIHLQGHMDNRARPGDQTPDLLTDNKKPPDSNQHFAFRTWDQHLPDGSINQEPEKNKGFLWDFELKDQVMKLLGEYEKLNKIRVGYGKLPVKFNVIVQVDTCFAEAFVSGLVGTANVSLAWATGKTCTLRLVGKQSITPWMEGFTSVFLKKSEGVVDPSTDVTVEDAHKSAAEFVAKAGKPKDIGADYSPHDDKPWNPNPNKQ
jgi:hypothetical protein